MRAWLSPTAAFSVSHTHTFIFKVPERTAGVLDLDRGATAISMWLPRSPGRDVAPSLRAGGGRGRPGRSGAERGGCSHDAPGA